MGRFSLHESPPDAVSRIERFAPPEETSLESDGRLNCYCYIHNCEAPKKRISIWWWILGGVLVAHVVARYGPPAPPPHATTNWQDFFLEEGTQLVQALMTLASVVPHVYTWCAKGLGADVSSVWREWTRPPPCPLVLLDSQQITFHLVGQPRAVSIVEDALNAWDLQRPLFLLLTGTVGVGKFELAKQVASGCFGNCQAATLVLDGEQQNEEVVSQVLSHIHSQRGRGAIIILRRLEALSREQVVSICRAIVSDKVVLIATTSIGSRSIHQYLKHHESMGDIPKLELEEAIREDVDDYFDGADIAKLFHTVAPFRPIGPTELREILQLRVERLCQEQAGRQWKSLVVTDELAAALVGPSNVEYIEWKQKLTGETILVFSASGADVLETASPIMNKVTAQIYRCLAEPKVNQIGRLDYDGATRQGVVSWCSSDDTESTVPTACVETCRFSLN